MVNTRSSAIIFFAVLITSAQTLAAEGGAYTSQPSETMKLGTANQWYEYQFPVTVLPEAGARVSVVYYEYALGPGDLRGRGTLSVKLCHGATDNCTDVSGQQTGSTLFFRGQDAGQPFQLYYGLTSDKPVISMTGSGKTQITVNWETAESH